MRMTRAMQPRLFWGSPRGSTAEGGPDSGGGRASLTIRQGGRHTLVFGTANAANSPSRLAKNLYAGLISRVRSFPRG